MKIGILALQGDVIEHRHILERIIDPDQIVEVKKPEQIESLDGLIIPGGESTTLGKLILKYNIDEAIRKNENMAIFGTCAGAILLSKDIIGSDQFKLDLMDTHIERNAFGRQVDSFEAELQISVLQGEPFHGVFIRGPIIRRVEKGVEILARYGEEIVLVRQGKLLAASFHPELTDDTRLHKFFIKIAKGEK